MITHKRLDNPPALGIWADHIPLACALAMFALCVPEADAGEAKPAIRVNIPAANVQVTNAVITVRGKATGKPGVQSVWCKLNTGDWGLAQGTNDWAIVAPLIPGTNTLSAYAVDISGKHSSTNTLRFFRVAPASLTLITNGVGTIVSTFPRTKLEIGRSYSVRACPGKGQLFSHWSGTVSPSENNPLTFVLADRMVLQANFTTNWFPTVRGTYTGLFYPATNVTASNSGALTLTVTDTGSYSGKLLAGGTSTVLSGKFDLAGSAVTTRSNAAIGMLQIGLELDPKNRCLIGRITNSAGAMDLFATMAEPSNRSAASYTMLLSGSTEDGAPCGSGAGVVVVKANGTGRASMTLADGMPATATFAVDALGRWPLYVSFYKGRGTLIGWMQCGSNAPVTWIKPSVHTDRYYPNGFVAMPSVQVSKYTAPAIKCSLFDWTDGLLSVTGGDMPEACKAQVVLGKNRICGRQDALTNLNLVVTPANGLFSGTFADPVTGKTRTVKGALVQGPDGGLLFGAGWFLGTNHSGQVELTRYVPTPFPQAASQITATRFVANWIPIDGATSYELDISTNQDFSSFEPHQVPGDIGTSYEMSGASLDTLYYYRVRAFLPPQWGDYSQTIAVKTPAFAIRPDTIWIQGGSFTQGSPASEALRSDDEQQRTVTIQNGFYMSRNLVTQEEMLAVLGVNPSYFTGDGKLPAEQVNWSDASNYCAKLTRQEQDLGRLPATWTCRLPTEAEWEYACRAGSTNAFYFGDTARDGRANFYSYSEYDASKGDIYHAEPANIVNKTSPVGSYPSNAWGLNDMCGNVWQWCQDWYGAYPQGGATDPLGPSSGYGRVVRGGSWGSIARMCRSAARGSIDPTMSNCYVGFRIVVVRANTSDKN